MFTLFSREGPTFIKNQISFILVIKMTELENFIEAFQLLGRYEYYRLRKSWGITVMVLGILSFFLMDYGFAFRISNTISRRFWSF